MAENKIIESNPSVFVNPIEFFSVLNDKVGLTSEQVKKICENLNYLYNNLGLADIRVGYVNTIFTEPGTLSDVDVFHREEIVEGKTYDFLDFTFKIPSPKIETNLTTELVENENSEMTLETEPINSGTRVVGYKYNFNARLFNGGNSGGQVETDTQFDLLSENPIANRVVTQNIVVRKSGRELSQLVGQTSSIYADMYTPCICSETYGNFIEGHIYLIYNEVHTTTPVTYRVAVKEIGVTGKKTTTYETFSNIVWNEDTAITPFGFKANVEIEQTLTDDTEVGIGNSIIEQSNFGLVVGEINGQVVTIYAITQPNVDIVVKLEV